MKKNVSFLVYGLLLIFGILNFLSASIYLYYAARIALIVGGIGILGLFFSLLFKRPKQEIYQAQHARTAQPLCQIEPNQQLVSQEWVEADWAMPEEHLSSSVDIQLERERDEAFQTRREEEAERAEQERSSYYDDDDEDDD